MLHDTKLPLLASGLDKAVSRNRRLPRATFSGVMGLLAVSAWAGMGVSSALITCCSFAVNSVLPKTEALGKKGETTHHTPRIATPIPSVMRSTPRLLTAIRISCAAIFRFLGFSRPHVIPAGSRPP